MFRFILDYIKQMFSVEEARTVKLWASIHFFFELVKEKQNAPDFEKYKASDLDKEGWNTTRVKLFGHFYKTVVIEMTVMRFSGLKDCIYNFPGQCVFYLNILYAKLR